MDSETFTIDVRRLGVLRELSRRGTVAATASALHLTPSAVSQQLAVLSRELGVPLLEKQGRGVRLTGQARVVLTHADAVAAQLERARADLAAWSDGAVGEVRVGSLASAVAAVVAPALGRLGRERPRLGVRVFERDPEEALAGLDAGELDVVVSVDHPRAPRRDDRRYTRVDLLVDVLDVLLPAGHPLAAAPAVALGDLADQVWVSGASSDPCSQIVAGACATAGFSPDVRHHCREWDAMAALVAVGAGVGLVPRLAHPLRPAGLAVRPLVGAPVSRTVHALTRAASSSDVATTTVLRALCAAAAERPDAAGVADRPDAAGVANSPDAAVEADH
jgi:DNA-binding transcriptional LysR family regulator